jgi:hypothetical protein
MASASRIDERNSLRMYVFKRNPISRRRFDGRPLSVGEREVMMGYPRGYVMTPGESWSSTIPSFVVFCPVLTRFASVVRKLFTTLLNDAFSSGHFADWGPDWRKTLEKKFHHFAGNYHELTVPDPYQCTLHSGKLWLKMAPPQTTKVVSSVAQAIHPTRQESAELLFLTSFEFCKALLF